MGTVLAGVFRDPVAIITTLLAEALTAIMSEEFFKIQLSVW